MPSLSRPPTRPLWWLPTLLTLGLAACAAGVPIPSPTAAPTPLPTPTPAWDGMRLPAPTGPYAVGYRQFLVLDEARDEIHTFPEDDRRGLALHIWYPADPAPGAQPGPYLDERLAAVYGLGAEANTWLGHAVEDAPPAAAEPVPVLMFNGGFNAMPTVYAVLAEEYASYGYAVAAPSHPYADELALLPDGQVVEYPGDTAFLMALGGSDPFGAEVYLAWIPDTLFALAELDRLNSEVFGGKLNLQRMGFLGHSFGGGVSAETCRIIAERCAGAANLDGSHPPRLQDEGIPAPYLYIAAGETGSAAAAEVLRVYEGAQAGAAIVEIEGATHFGFGDGYYLRAALGALDDEPRSRYGALEPERMAAIVRAYTLAFFDRTVRGSDAPALEELAASDPEVSIRSRHPGE